MKTHKVSKYTYLANKYRKNGKAANKIIDRATNAVYQRIFKDGTIALQTRHNRNDHLVLIKPNGEIIDKAMGHAKGELDGQPTKLWAKVVDYFYSDGMKQKQTVKEKFYAGTHLDELANREYNIGREVKNSVLSFYRRKSEFPQTRVGKNMHNFTIMKYKDEYEGMLYVENYPHN